MTITPTTLTRGAAAAAVAAGLIFIGVQVNHPHMDAVSVTTTEVVVRNSLKVLMAENGLEPLLTKAVAAATARSRALAKD